MGVLRRNSIESQPARLQEIGRLRKGGAKEKKKTQDGKEYLGYGKDLDHFRFTPDDRLLYLPSSTHENLHQEVLARWEEMKESTCGWKSIPILLPYKSIADNFTWRNATYDKAGRCTRRCDGVICDRYTIDAKTSAGKAYKAVVKGAIECAMKDGMDECPAGCKAEGKLSVILPGLYPGLVLLTTRSIIDIQTIQSNLKGYERFDLSRIPMRLCRSLRDASYWDKGEYKSQEKWLLHIEIDPQYGQLALQAQQEQYKAELTGQPIQQVRSIASSAPMPALLPHYEDTDAWKTARSYFFKSKSPEEVAKVVDWCYKKINEGALPVTARAGIDREQQAAMERLNDGVIGMMVEGEIVETTA